MDNGLLTSGQHPLSAPSASSISFPSRDLHTGGHHESERALEAMVRKEEDWLERFPRDFRPDIEFLLRHPSGQNLKTHQCMGAAHTHTFQTADHTRVTPHTLLAAEIAMEMARHLAIDPVEAKPLVAAVAGHDQGHIFASHESEIAINTFPEFDGAPGRPAFCHERRTKELFESDDFTRYFGDEQSDRIKAILFDATHPLHILVDWADRLAYLIADSLHLGHQDIITSCHIRRNFIESLRVLPDETIGFATLSPVLSLINARDLLYSRVSIGRASSLFSGFLTEAFHRAIAVTGKPITQFVHELSERTTPQARQLFLEADIPRLYCPQQHPTLAKPVDLDYRALCHVTITMLSEKGRDWAIDLPALEPEATIPACVAPRANMRRFEHLVRSALREATAPGFVERGGALIGLSHMPSKHYNLRTLDAVGEVREIPVQGKENWEFFIGVPNTEQGARTIHQIACDALIQEGLIRPEYVEQLQKLPAADFFTRYH